MWSSFFKRRQEDVGGEGGEQSDDDPIDSSSSNVGPADVDSPNGHAEGAVEDVEIVPVVPIQMTGSDSDERIDRPAVSSRDGDPAVELSGNVPVISHRVFSPEGTEFLTPANSPPVAELTTEGVDRGHDDGLGSATEAADLVRQNRTRVQPSSSSDSIESARPRRTIGDVELTATPELKRHKPHTAKATEEDELRKIQALEDEIMSGKSLDSETDQHLDEDRPDIIGEHDFMFDFDDVLLGPPTMEYRDDDATPVPGVVGMQPEVTPEPGRSGVQRDVSGSDHEKRSNHSGGSTRPDNVPQLVLATAKSDVDYSNDEGEADDEGTHRSTDHNAEPPARQLTGISPTSILFPDLGTLPPGRDPCDEIMNRIDSELMVINENIERAHSPERFAGHHYDSPHRSRSRASPSPPRRTSPSVPRRTSPSAQRRTSPASPHRVSSPYRRMSPSPRRVAPTDISEAVTDTSMKSLHKSKPQFDEVSVRTEDFAEQFQSAIVQTPKSTARSEPRLHKPNTGRDKAPDSDLESVQTEDFLREYRKTMVPTLAEGRSKKIGESDLDSVRTEEFERKYRDYIVNTQKALLQNSDRDRGQRAAAGVSGALQRQPEAPRPYAEVLKAYKKRGWESANVSELDSARTDENYEYTQQSHQSPHAVAGRHVAGRHVAGVPLESFDEILVDSDVDTVKSAEVRNKFRSAMAHSKGRIYTPSDQSEEDISEKKYRDYIARKLTEISRLPRIDASASDIDKAGLEDETEYEEESDAGVMMIDQQQQHEHSQMRPTASPQYDFYDQDELTSQDEEVNKNASEIHRESRRIAREMEDERRKRILLQQQQQARVAKSIERGPIKAIDSFKRSRSPDQCERRSAPIRTARSLDRLSRTPTKSPEVRRHDPQSIERAVFAKEIKEKLVELQVLADTVEEARTEKRTLINELRGLRDAYNDSQNELKLASMHSKDFKTKADDLKTELTVLEYKRDNTQHELDDVEKNLSTKRQRLEELDHHIRDNLERLKDFEELGMTAEQVKGIMTEKDKLKTEVGKQEAVSLERDLLKEKLLLTKEELYEAEKRSRSKIDLLEAKLDASVRQTQDLQTDKTYLQQQLKMLEEKYDNAIRDKDYIIKEKEQDYDRLHRNLQAELDDIKQEAMVDTSRLKKEIESLQDRVMSLKDDLDEKNDGNTKLRDQILDLQMDLNRETELREKETQQHKDRLTRLEVEKDASNSEIRERLYAEKQNELQETYDLFEQERRELAVKQENRLAEQLAHHHQELIARDEENQMLREQVRMAEDAARTSEDRAQKGAKQQMHEDMEHERQQWEAERDRIWKLELAKISGESVRAVQHAREDAEREKDICQHLERQIEIIKQELEEQRQANRASYKDKMDSIGRLKETAREEKDVAIERARSRAIDESNREIERLNLKLDAKDDEIKRLRAENEQNECRERDCQLQSDKHDKTVIHEINDDCKQTAILLGVTPRKAVPGGRRTRDTSPTRSAVHAALANLRACNEQLRSYVHELKIDIDNQRQVMINIQREKEEALNCLKEKLVAEKSADMDILRERLIKDHMEELVRLQQRSPDKAMKQALIDKDAELREIQRNMNVWKEEVADKFAKKFEEELSRELEKRTRDLKRNTREKDRSGAQQQREIERLEREVGRLSASTGNHHEDSETIKLLRHLQNRVKELRSENNQLKRNNILSSGALDYTNNDSVRSNDITSHRTLENRIKQVELRAELAEDRATRNEQLLNSKISEISRLQSALTHQTKEMMQLERAYKTLQLSPAKR